MRKRPPDCKRSLYITTHARISQERARPRSGRMAGWPFLRVLFTQKPAAAFVSPGRPFKGFKQNRCLFFAVLLFAENQSPEEDDQARACDRQNDAHHPAASDSDKTSEPTAESAADNTEDNIAKKASVTLHDFACEPAGEAPRTIATRIFHNIMIAPFAPLDRYRERQGTFAECILPQKLPRVKENRLAACGSSLTKHSRNCMISVGNPGDPELETKMSEIAAKRANSIL